MNSQTQILAAFPEDTGRRLTLYADLLRRWQPTINLVAPSTLPDLWSRHIGDSLQVQAALPHALTWLDFGSGGGFPGLVTAIVLADRPGARVHLVESDKRKAAFLRTVSRETGAPAEIHAERIEAFNTNFEGPVDAVSARALAPLATLVAYAEKYLLQGAIGVFPKGQQAEAELTALSLDRRYQIESVPSQTQETARLLIVRALSTWVEPPR
jgi:16S rRNA (guanine527-N7)-methyltransferase